MKFILTLYCVFTCRGAFGLTITEAPANTSSTSGEDIVLKCETSESGNPDYVEWFEYITESAGRRIWISADDPSDIAHPVGAFEITGTYNLKINSPGLAYGGKYGCKLIIQDEMSRTAYVSIFEPAQCDNIGNDLHEGDMAYISCLVRYGSDIVPQVNFYREGKKIDIDYERGNDYIYISSNITANAEEDAMPFQCQVNLTQPLYGDTCTTQLDIKYTARNLTFEPHWPTYYNGDRIECKAKGNPRPTIQWEKIYGSASEANVEGVYLHVTADMVGSHVWACNANNTVQGNLTTLREVLEFEVVPGSTTLPPIQGASSAVLSLVAMVMAALATFIRY